MAQNWTPIVRPPKDGEPVNQETIRRSLQSLQQRTDFLYQRLVEFSAQNGKLVIQGAKLATDVNVGDWLYYDSDSGRYHKAIAEAEYNTNTQQYYASKRSYVVGLCISKTDDIGSVLMGGWIEDMSKLNIGLGIDPTEMMQTIDGVETFVPGRFYLSRKQPGKMTRIVGSPLIQLGFFNEESAFVFPQQKDVFESHVHHKFNLIAKPASSQNTSGTGLAEFDDAQVVDYFFSASDPITAPREILMAVKGNGASPETSLGEEFRIEVFRPNSSDLAYRIFGGNNIDFDLPTSGTLVVPAQTFAEWPEYGQWIDIPSTGVSVAFYRLDGTYNNSFETDLKNASVGISVGTDSYKFFYPNDTLGWTNANPFSSEYATGAKFRYMREFHEQLNAVWPPVPSESASVTSNGIELVSEEDFVCYPQELFWKQAGITESKTYGPWAHNYAARLPNTPGFDVPPPTDADKDLILFFAKSNLSNANPVVLSLQSGTQAIVVQNCFTGNTANTGHLKLGLRLDLNGVDGPDAYKCYADVDPVTQKFIRSSVVSRLRAGNGITIRQINQPNAGSPETGPLIISSNAFQSSGEVSIVSLRNAKESLHNGITPCVLFMPPQSAKCQIVSKIRIPDSPVEGTIQLTVLSSMFGSMATGELRRALFKAVHYVLRDGTNINAFSETDGAGTFFGIQYWGVNLTSYSSYQVLPAPLPDTNSIIPSIEISGASGVTLSQGMVNGVDGQTLLPGDTVLSVIERVASFSNGLTDNYSGDIGITNIVWRMNVV